MAQKFNEMEFIVNEPQHSSVDMSCSLRGTGKLGRIIPSHVQSLLPGQTLNYTPNTLVRFAPLAAPLMSNMTLRHHCFSIPYRQLYANWEEFITGGEFNNNDDALPTFTIQELYTGFNMLISGSIVISSPKVFASNFKNGVRRAFSSAGYGTVFDQMFRDRLAILEHLTVSEDIWNSANIETVNDIMGLLMNMIVGTGSLLDYLGYPVRDFGERARQFNSKELGSELSAYFKYTTVKVGTTTTGKVITGFMVDPDEVAFDNVTKYNDALIRAYYRVWYYFFRDENRDKVNHFTPNEIMKSTALTSETLIAHAIQTSNKNEFLYFLLLRPCAWKKDLANTAQVEAYVNNAFVPVSTSSQDLAIDYNEIQVFSEGDWNSMKVPTQWLSQISEYAKGESHAQFNPMTNGLTGFSLKNLQKVEALAKWLDKGMLGWTYPERLKTSFGINYSNKAMQLPEYEGGTKSMVDTQTLTNNTTTSEQVAGSQTGYAQGITANDGMRCYAEEHMIFLDLMSVLPELSYKYSTHPTLKYVNKFDFPWPEFDQLGESVLTADAVANSITYNDDDASYNNLGFGYVSRYAEATNNLNRLCGGMITQLPLYSFTQEYTKQTGFQLDFGQNPNLSAEFIHCVPTTDVFVSDTPEWEFVFDHQASIQSSVPLRTVQYV